MARPRTVLVLLGVAAAAFAVMRHRGGAAASADGVGRILMGHTAVYDLVSHPGSET